MKNLLSGAAMTAALLAFSSASLAQDLTVTWADDSTSDVGYDPRVTQSRHEEQVIVQIFDQLIAADAEGTLHPGLATEWTVSDDNKSVTLKLREGVTFHDGTPFDAEAVKFTFDTIVDPATGSQGAVDLLGPYAGSEVLGPYEIRIDYERPFPGAVASYSENELSPVSPAAVEALGNTGFAQAPVGTGPFKFESWEKGSEVVLVRNDDYAWAPEFYDNEGPSQVSKIVHKFINNAGTRVAALETGEVDVSDLTPPLDIRRLSDSGKFETVVGVASGVPFSIMLNTSRGPLQDIKVRQALFHAIDRPRLAENLFFGLAKPAFGPISSATPAYWPGVEDYYPYDPEKAAALLEEAGWTMGADGIREKDGEKLSIHYASLLEPDTAVALQAKAKEVGIDLAVEIVTKAKQDELILANEYHMGEIRWVFNSPSVLVIPFSSTNIPEPGKFKFNWMRWNEPKLDETLQMAAMATSADEVTQLYADAQKMIMDYAAFMPIHDQVQTVAYSSAIEGLRFAPGNWQVRLYDVRPAE
ncbi:ABC transporter substrate-binding protein [Halovulum sp. GXIMD14794]